MNWLFWLRGGRRRSPFNNWGPQGLTCARVAPHLLVGGELGPDDWRALEEEGVSVVINLQQEQQDFFGANEHLDASLWLPAPDGLAPTLEQLALGVDLIENSARAGKTVFVHCKAGQGRAPLLCACYLIRDQKIAPLEAIGRVRQARSRTQLTPEQNVRLREYAAFETARNAASSAALNAATSNLDTRAETRNELSSSFGVASKAPASESKRFPERAPNGGSNSGEPFVEASAQAPKTFQAASSPATSAEESEVAGPLTERLLKARAQGVTPRNGRAWHEQTSHAQSLETEASESDGKI